MFNPKWIYIMVKLIKKIWNAYQRGFYNLYGPAIEAGVFPYI